VSALSSPRPYRSELRREQAAGTRERILAAAAECFAELGYAKTTMAEIARRAGVSVETVHKNGPKGSLLQGAFEFSSAGIEGQQQFLESNLASDVLSTSDAREALRRTVAVTHRLNSGSVGVWRAYAAAADTDPEIAARWRTMQLAIHAAAADVIDQGIARGWMRTDLTRDELVATQWILASIDNYDRLVTVLGWSGERYREWLERASWEASFALKGGE